jgi:hypothetical protein
LLQSSQKYGFGIRDLDKTHPGSGYATQTDIEGPPEVIRLLLEVHEREIVEDEGDLVLLLLQWSVCFLVVLINNRSFT